MPTPGIEPIGPATKVGFGVSTAAFAAALTAFLAGDRSEQTLGVLVSASVGAVLLVVTLLGRYWQAAAKAKTPTVQSSPLLPYSMSGVLGSTSYISNVAGTTALSGEPCEPCQDDNTVTTESHIEPYREVPGGSIPVSAPPSAAAPHAGGV